MATAKQAKPRIKLKPTKPSTEVAVERNITEIETIDTILTEKLDGINAYRDLLIDDKVIGCWGQRQTALTQLERQVIAHDPDNKADVEAAAFIEAQLKRINFDQILKAMHYGIYYGRAHAEAMWGLEDGKVVLDNLIVRDRALFKYDKDKQLIYTGNDGDERLPDNKFWSFSAGGDTTDNPYGLGLAHFLYWLVLFKKANIKFWLLGNEKMATSLPHVQYDPRAADVASERKKALQAGIALKNGSAIATAQGTTVELLKGVAGTEDYESLCRYMDEGIATVILGQVMTSQAVGGQYKADVQDSVKDDIIKADADLLCASLNNSIVKWLTEWNFPNANPPKVWLLTKDEVDQQATAQTYANMAKLGYRPTLDTVKETFGGEWERITTTTTADGGDAVAQGGKADKADEADEKASAKPTLNPTREQTVTNEGDDKADFAEVCPCGCGDAAHDFTESFAKPFSDSELNLLLAKDFETLLQIDANNREELTQQVIDKYPDLSFGELQQFLTKILFVSQVFGQQNAKQKVLNDE